MSRRCVQEGRVGTVTARCAILLALTLAVPQTLRAAPGDLAPGAVDPTFGISITPIGSGNAMARALVLQGDGKLVAAGFACNGADNDFALARFNADGTLDTTFGMDRNGIVQLDVGHGSGDEANAVARDDDQIVAAGFASPHGEKEFAVVRLNSDGQPDNKFGQQQDGTQVVDVSGVGSDSSASAVIVLPDGVIIAAGAVTHLNTDDDFAVAEFASNNGQYIPVHIPAIGLGTDHINAVVVQSDLKVVVAGWASLFGTDDFALEQLTTDLMLDTTFMSNGPRPGIFTRDRAGDDRANAVVLQGDKIVVAGFVQNQGNDDFALMRFTGDGRPDMTFGVGGIARVDVGKGRNDQANAVVLQHDQKLVAAGFVHNQDDDDFALVRFTKDGQPDMTFGVDGNGMVITDVGKGHNDRANALVLQPDGNLVAAGYAFNDTDSDFAIVRYIGGPTTGGATTTSTSSTSTTSTTEPHCGNGRPDLVEDCDPGPPGSPDSYCCTRFCTVNPFTINQDCGVDRPLRDCEMHDKCDAQGRCRPNVTKSGVECRPPGTNSPCDLGDVCDGVSPDCPAKGDNRCADVRPLPPGDTNKKVDVLCRVSKFVPGTKCSAVGFQSSAPSGLAEARGQVAAQATDTLCGGQRVTAKVTVRLKDSGDPDFLQRKLTLTLNAFGRRLLQKQGSLRVCVLVKLTLGRHTLGTERETVTLQARRG